MNGWGKIILDKERIKMEKIKNKQGKSEQVLNYR